MTASNRPSSRSEFVDLVASAGPEPEGVDQVTHIIASLPSKQLSRAITANTLDYFDYERDLNENDGRVPQYIRENPTPEMALANDIVNRQGELSKNRRGLAVAATFLALFAGGAGVTDKAIQDSDKALSEITKSHVYTYKSDRLKSDALVGGLAGLAGGMVMSFSVMMNPGRFSRRPAQKIVRKAAKASK